MFRRIRPLVSLWGLLAVAGVAVAALGAAYAGTWPADVAAALDKAGDNRAELQKVLEHYERLGDGQKLDAAQFLIANMDGHGFALAAFYDEDKNEIEFNALDYADFKEAQAALDALEDEHGDLHYARKRFDADLETITADFLIENVDLAFQAWRTKPWAKSMSFEAFCEYILPYRGSNEPISSTRAACMEPFRDLPSQMKDPSDPKEAAGLIYKGISGWVGFDEIYYLHPTDESFEEMKERGLGRCEDITNMQMYCMRANAVASASDYTPFWADRDNNHAWQVILDQDGRGKAGLSNRAAKIYRKTYSIQQDSLACRKDDDEKVPRWLGGKNYKDVTDEYMETTDVTVGLENEKPEGARFAYICVFNGGEWKSIHWGEIAAEEVTFTRMGRNIAYLAAYYVDEELVPAAPPFILTQEGEIQKLDGAADSELTIELTATTPETPDADTQVNRPNVVVEPGGTYELFVWNDGWDSLGKQTAGDEPVAFESVPAGKLYWLVEEDSRRLERIFTIEKGKQVWW